MSFVTKENTQDIYPLSPTQKGMLFHSVLDDSTPVYFEQLAFTINGPLDIDAFRGAWDHLIAVTPVFRTVFKWKKVKEPIQIVLKQLPVNLNVHDVTHLDKDIQEERIREFLEDDKNTPLHFEEGPLIRLNIFKLGQEVNHFIWSHHHLIIDGWCLPIILQDMFNNYMSLIAKSPLPVPSRRPYRDYISWYLKKDAAIAMDFWKSKIGDVDSPTPLPIDRMPGKSPHVEVAEEKLLLSEEMTEKLQTLSKNERITQSALMQAVWSLLLSRYSGRDDVLTGIVVSGRPVDLKGSEEMIGLFINTLPVRVTFTHDMTVSELLQSVQDFTLAIRDYEYSLLLDVKTCSAIPTIQNLFDSIVVFENYPVENLAMGQDVGFSITNANGFEMTNFPLTVLIAPGPQMSINIQYYKELFNKETIDQILGHMHQVLSTIVENSQIKLSELDILTSQEREKILVSFNDTVSPFPKDKCPYQLFEKQVEKTPERTAIFFEEKTISYKTLNEKANQLARFLRKKGVGNDDKVGLLVERSFDMIIGILGIHKAGGAYVPMDPEYPKARLEYTLDDSESPVLVTQSTLLEGLSKYPENVVLLDTHWDEIAKENQENLQLSANPENLSHLIYTSGSTGLPKGVMLEHGNVTAFLFWALDEFTYDEYEEMIASTSMCFDLSVFEFFLPLITGAKIVLLHSSLDIDGYLETHTATMINTVPSALKHLLSVMKNRHRIKAINLAGEPLKLDLVQHAYAHLDVDIIRNLYGPTEDTTYSTGYRIPRDIDRQPLIGKPIANTRAYILDNYLKPVPVGMLGEIYLAGTNLARGYWKAPEKTKERFIPNPYSQDAYPYLYKTGDLGKWQPDGNIEFHGRVDYQVKIRGNRIEMGEIETRLSEHENIR
ncbi:MAG: amino acid adenylation domain-containing protein, partial [Desulfobacterales bacterium]|nr:amino acid adenylation domain-containing protein [Desulfobacterales bacterium]